MKLQDKVAILTGAASGIGEAVAKRYLDEGAKVVVVDVKDEGELAQRFTRDRGPRARLARRRDASATTSSASSRATVERFGGIDILFNNAALFDMRPILDESWDVYDRLFAVNVKGMFFLMQAVALRMVEQGRGGKIINMSSQAGRRGEALVSHYCATKAAVISYTQSAALALAQAAHQRERHRAGRRRYADVGAGRRALRQVREPAARREEAPRRRGSAARPHGRCRPT